MDKNLKLASAIISAILAIILFFTAIDSPLPAIARFAIAVAILSGFGLILMKLYKIEGWYGIMLWRSKWGLSGLDSLAKMHPAAWQLFADLGLVVAYGSFAYFLMDKGRKRSLARLSLVFGFGAILLILLSSLIAPLASSALFSMLSGGEEFAATGSKLSSDISQFSFARYAFIAILGIGGLATLATVNLLIYAGVIGFAIVQFFLGSPQPLMTAAPGGVPLIPGKNLPLFEGVAALAVVLAVHEACHGILARLYRLPLKSAGLVFFGFLPFGAFVDIDEKKLLKEKPSRQNSVFVAGTAANFATSFVFLALLLGFIAATEQFRESGLFVVSGTLPAGAKINSINGAQVYESLNFALQPNTTYTFGTSKGDYDVTTNGSGNIGILYTKADKSGASGQLRYSEGFAFMNGILGFLALTFALNFVVGAINLIPLPLFDGYHVMRNGIGNRKVSAFLVYLISIAFVLTMLPWVLR